MKTIISILILFSFFTLQIVSGEQPITFEDFFTMKRVGKPVVSPDGETIAFTVKIANIEQNNYSTQIWLVNSDGKILKNLTGYSSFSSNPIFSSDSKNLYFISDGKENEEGQIWRLSLENGDTKQITDLSTGVNGFVLSPKGDRLLMESSVYPECDNDDCNKRITDEKTNSKVKARIIDQLMYRHWNEWREGKRSHLILNNISGSEYLDVTPGDYDTPPVALGSSHDYSFSPDGEEICFVSNHDQVVATSTNNDVFVIQLNNGEITKISPGDGNDCNPHYSPNGNYIAYSSMERAGFEADRFRLMLFNRKDKSTMELTKGFNLGVSEIIWSPKGEKIYFTAEEAGNLSLYVVNIKTNKIDPVLKGHNISGLSEISNDKIVFLKQMSQMPYEIFNYDLKSEKLKQLTFFNKEKLDQLDLPAYEEFWFTGANGDKVQGFIMKPPNFEEGKKYPAVHMIHGGPQGMWSDEFHYRWNYQMFAAPGYVAYWINFHGSTGYGQKFTDSISGHWGDFPYEDLVKGTLHVVNNYNFVDKDRLAAAGASYGGFMINWIAGHDNPYKCLITHDGVYDQKSMWGATEELWFPEWDLGGVPWQEGTTYEKWSPSRLAANFKTPMLVIHGEHDYRVPYTQGLQLFSALQRQGVPSRLLFFPDEGHFVQKPQNAQLWWKTVYGWLDKYL